MGVDPSQELRAHARSRLGFKLGKFAVSVTRVTVRLTDESGPTGKPAIACTVKVVLAGAPSVIVEVHEADTWAAVDTALDRAERAVRRALSRRRTVSETGPRGRTARSPRRSREPSRSAAS